MADLKPSPSHDGSTSQKPIEVDMPSTTHHDEKMLATEAKHASDAEHNMSLLTAIKTYPKAIGWSMLLSSTLIMEGYDLALLSSLYASQVFNKKYGDYNPATGKYAISAAWQSGLSNGARAGEIIGLILAGWTADRYGELSSGRDKGECWLTRR
jgi:SP family general alpha glucoside:H+ symporter-like MFS transporter